MYGDSFKELYYRYVKEGQYRKKVKARDLWHKILVSQIETGMPYMLYKDTINNKSNQSNIGTIKSSNLCVAPETKILTDKGYKNISTLENNTVNVWNGEEFSKTRVLKTGINQEVITVYFNNGLTIDCTPYHHFYIYDKNMGIIKIEAKNLQENDELVECVFPVIKDNMEDKLKWLAENTTYFNDPCLNLKGPKEFLKKVLLDLQTLGINETGYLEEITKDVYSLRLSRNIDRVKVSLVKNNGRKTDTFCFTETKRGMGVFNGMLTGQCAEITLVSNTKETAVCNICTFSLSKFLDDKYFNHDKLYDVVKIATRNMNNVIDYNYYPTPEAEKSNLGSRPVALGVQGLANLFFKLKIPFDSQEAKQLNKDIMETIQFAAWTASNEIAREKGKTYDTYTESPISKGVFQHDMWGIIPSNRWNWEELREQIKKYGVYNSMCTALPPTASTSQILGNYESFEPQNSNIFMRSTLSGDFPIVNEYLVRDLQLLDLWNTDMKNEIIANKGSVQAIPEIPNSVKEIYKTIWEISQKTLLEMSRDRAYFVDQSQSLNVYMESPSIAKLSSMHFYGWNLGLKTGMYYLRTRSASSAQQFTVSPRKKTQEQQILACSIDNRDACQSCSG